MNQTFRGNRENNTLKDTIKQFIRTRIIENKLKPGQRIVETEIARELKVSQIPVREALCGLEEEGLVKSVKYTGSFVTEVDNREMYHMHLLRTYIEATSLEITLPTLSRKDFGALHDIVDAMGEKQRSHADYATISALDIEFHRTIVGWSGIEAYNRIWTMLNGHVRRFINVVHPQIEHKQDQVYEDHKLLLDILEARDVDKAKAAIRAHIMDVFDRGAIRVT
jgi:DNA-binding GntR family transcriptional regulator